MQPDLIGGRYRVEDAIGQGGMGTVWRARDEKLARLVAVKQVGLLPGESVTDSARALREARSTAALSHRNVVTVFDVVDEDRAIWLVMELVPSRSLAEIIREDGPLPPAMVARIGADVAGGLAAAHGAGIVHRDVKPGNILVTDDGVAKISDFGIARTDGDPALTQAGMFIGTPAYFAPELAKGEEPTPAADVWALGASLYAAVEGEPPYELSTNHLAVLSRIADQDPPPPRRADFLEPTIGRMMERDPSFRWSMGDAAHALRRLAAWNEEPSDATATGVLGAAVTADDAGQTAAWSAETPAAADPADSSDHLEAPDDTAAAGGWNDEADPEPERRRRGRGPLVALVAALALLAVGGVASLALDQGATPADSPTSSSPTERTKPKETEGPREEDSPTPEETPTKKKPPAQQPTQAQAVSATDGQAAFIQDYFNTVPEDTDTGWSMLGPDARSVGRDSYEGWWASVADVRVGDIDTGAAGDSAGVTLTYTMRDGRVETERQRLTLIRSQDGGWLINGDEPA